MRIFLYKQRFPIFMELTAYYPILAVFGVLLLILIIIIGAFFFGKRKYNKQNGIVKEKKAKERKTTENKTKEKKSKSSIRLSEKDAAAAAAFNKSDPDGYDDDEYKEAVDTLKAESLRNKDQEVIQGPIIVVDENKVKDDVVEWKPPADDKIIVAEKEEATIAEPAADGWNDEDLELFEARTYSFDEENQAGYVREGKPAAREPETPSEPVPVFRERREQAHDPADDEGVQVFETFEKPEQKTESKAEPEVKDGPKISNSKYAYFDAVMENEKGSAPEKEWQPPVKKEEKASPEKPKKTGMQYIELDLEDDK